MEWIESVKARGLTHVVLLALDVLEPFGVLGAQILYVAQPFSGVFGASDIVNGLARVLEDRDELELLRGQLEAPQD